MVRHSRASRRRKRKTPPSHTGSTLALLVLACFFVSGLTGLIYEIVWMRMIVKIMGGAPFAVAIVLTVFMGGLGLGSYLAGRTCDRVEKPGRLVQLYGLLELAIGAYGLALPFLLQAFRPLYAVIYNGLSDHFLLYNLITFAGCFLLLIIPVTCMGATLPILSRFMVTRLSHVGMHVGRLYGLNTIGAAVGSLLCGFWLLEHLGIWGSLGTAIIFNIGIGVTCLLAGRSEEKPRRAVTETPPPSTQPDIAISSKQRLAGHGSLVIFAVSGFCAMGYEVLWTRLLGLIIGPTTYSFTLVLVTFIIGLAVGAMLFGRIADRSRNPVLLLLYTQVAAALAALIISHLIGNSQIFFSKLIYEYKDSFTLLVSLKSLVLFAIIFPATVFLGGAFPLVTRIYMRSLATRGRSVGFAYAVNSVGAVLGSFCAGFVLLPLLGKENGLSLIVGLQLATAVIVGTIIYRVSIGSWGRWVRLAVPVLIGLLALVQFPRWDRKLLSIGLYHQFVHPERLNLGWLEALFSGAAQFSKYQEGKELIYFGDGIGGFTAVFKATEDVLGNVSYSMLNSGKVDASTRGRDMRTQTMLAHFPMLFHDNPADVLVLGLGSGITAGEILHYPVEKLDIIEINQQVVAGSDFFIPWNNDLLADQRTRLIIQDGRAHLALTDRTYDVVVSEPSNPWMAGLASLFTLDFFDDVKNRLKDDGVFIQWLHAYQMDWATFAMVGRTFARAFPDNIMVLPRVAGAGGDCFLVGFKGDRRLDPDTPAEKIKYARKSGNITLGDYRMLYNFIINENLTEFFGDGPINTDNRPRLEFAAPRQLHTTDETVLQRLLSHRWVGERTAAFQQHNRTSIDAQIDMAAYALFFNDPFPDMVDLSGADSSQRERYSELLRAYCTRRAVVDFSFVSDDDLRAQCVEIQLAMVRGKLDSLADKTRAYCLLGRILAGQGDLDQAAEEFQSAIQVAPGSAEAHYGMALIRHRQNRLPEAIRYAARALEIDPNLAEAHDALGLALAQSGKLEMAIQHFREAVRLKPDHPGLRSHLEYALRRRSNRVSPGN